MPTDRPWLSQLAPQLRRQQEAITALLDLGETSPPISSLSVGCSIGRGAADALSDVDVAIDRCRAAAARAHPAQLPAAMTEYPSNRSMTASGSCRA